MPPQRTRFIYYALAVLAIGVIYQSRSILWNFLFVILGISRDLEPIDNFPWTCTRLHHPLLEGCEDMWLDHEGRKVYGACTSVISRGGWNPGGNKYNISARSRTDHVAILDIDSPGYDGLYGLRQLKVSGYPGDSLDVHGFDVHKIGDKLLRFWLINHRPPVDHLTGEYLDPSVVGANSTVEIFDLDEASETLEYVKTISSEAIITPNDLAVDKDGVGFVITNDHDTKVGAFRDLEMIYGSGSLTYCNSDTGKCHIAAKEELAFPNGIASDSNGFYYVSNSVTGVVSVHRLQDNSSFLMSQIDAIPLGYPVDNISLDVEGNLIAAGMPDVIGFVKASEDPYGRVAPATILSVQGIVGKIQSGEKQYNVSKIVEDKHAKGLPSSTIALHDVKSRRLFVGGAFSPFVSVCKQHD